MRTPDAKKGSEGELPFSVCFFAIEGDDRLGVLEECGASERVPKKFRGRPISLPVGEAGPLSDARALRIGAEPFPTDISSHMSGTHD